MIGVPVGCFLQSEVCNEDAVEDRRAVSFPSDNLSVQPAQDGLVVVSRFVTGTGRLATVSSMRISLTTPT